MALVRCKQCGKLLKGAKRTYVESVEPVGYPDTAVICGIKRCTNPGLVWLEAHELERYKDGEKIFEPPSASVKFKVK